MSETAEIALEPAVVVSKPAETALEAGRPPYSTTPPPGIGSTAKPAFTQASQPPISATAFFHPAFLSSSATRELVASSSQAQKATSQASLGNCSRSAS